jgi:hypothetical protein
MKALGLASALAVFATGCGANDPEAEIRALLAAAEEAAEARDVGFFSGVLADGYRDTRGNDREAMLRTLRGYFIANQRIEVLSRVDEIVIEADGSARAVVHAGMAGRRADAALIDGIDVDLYRFELSLVDDGGGWQVINADFRRAVGE